MPFLITTKPLTLQAIWQDNDDSSVTCLLNYKSLDLMDGDSRRGVRSHNRRLKALGGAPFPHPAYTGVRTTVGRKPNLGAKAVGAPIPRAASGSIGTSLSVLHADGRAAGVAAAHPRPAIPPGLPTNSGAVIRSGPDSPISRLQRLTERQGEFDRWRRDISAFHDPASVRIVRRRLWANHDPFLAMRANPETGSALVQ